jgi:hypothetical protein
MSLKVHPTYWEYMASRFAKNNPRVFVLRMGASPMYEVCAGTRPACIARAKDRMTSAFREGPRRTASWRVFEQWAVNYLGMPLVIEEYTLSRGQHPKEIPYECH